jgi:hypothetical protein
MTIPNLAGVATKDLVESIGAGSFKASYINWSRTLQLLRQHAPGWLVDTVPNAEGGLLHRAPVGAYLLIRFVHVDGTVTPAVPQAIMDNRNASIAYDKISARDITDTQRRGACLAAAMTFGLAAELWAKMPLENGWGTEDAPVAPASAPLAAKAVAAPQAVKAAPGPTAEAPGESSFRECGLEVGLSTHAVEALLERIKGDYATGLTLLKRKSAAEIEALNAQYTPAEGEEQW